MRKIGVVASGSTEMDAAVILAEGDEYHSAAAKTIDEAKALIETGFEYVCTHEDLMLFRKRK